MTTKNLHIVGKPGAAPTMDIHIDGLENGGTQIASVEVELTGGHKNPPTATGEVKDGVLKLTFDGLQGAQGQQGERGEAGPEGEKGQNGNDGPAGIPGKDGVGVKSIEVTYDENGRIKTLKWTDTDGTQHDATVTNNATTAGYIATNKDE